MPQPSAVTSAADDLVRVYFDAWQRITDEQERILADPTRARRSARLNELRLAVEDELAALDVPTRGWLRTRLPEVYSAGAEPTLRRLGESAMSWTNLHRSAVQQLATDTFNDLLSATRFVREDTKRFIRDVAKAASERTLTTGRTAQQGARTLRDAMRGKGITAVIYRNGARHGLADYADTVIRAKTAIAYSTGTVNTAVERGFETFRVFDGPGCGWTAHTDPQVADGMLVSAADALAWPISHPRCQRGFAAEPQASTVQPTRTSPGRFAAPSPVRVARPARQPRRARRLRNSDVLVPAGPQEEET